MNEQLQSLRADIGFMKAIAEDSGPAFQRDGMILAATGFLWGSLSIIAWMYLRGFVDLPRAVMKLTLYVPVPIMLIIIFYLARRFPRSAEGAASRAMSAAWAGLGWSAVAIVVAMIAASVQLQAPRVWFLILTAVFALYGMGWWVAYIVKRRASYAVIAAGCFLTTIVTGALVATHELFLVCGLGLLILVAAPGLAIIREARSVHR